MCLPHPATATARATSAAFPRHDIIGRASLSQHHYDPTCRDQVARRYSAMGVLGSVRAPDRIVPYQSRWPIDVGSVVYTDHAHYTLFLLDMQDDSVLAAPRPAEAFQLIVQGLGDSPGILAQRPSDELENRPSGVERDSPGRPRLGRPEHSGREPDGVCVAHASASSWRWRSSSAARRSSSV